MRVVKARPSDADQWGLSSGYDGVVPLIYHLRGRYYSSLTLSPADNARVAALDRRHLAALPFTLFGVPGWVWHLGPPHDVRCWDQLGRPGPRSSPPVTVIPFFPYARRRTRSGEATGGLDPTEDGIADVLAGYGLHADDVGMARAAFEGIMAARRGASPFAFPFVLLGRPGVGWRAAARHYTETNSYDLLGQPTRRKG